MRKPIRIQLSRRKGWRLPPNTVVVSRPSKWGNPFVVHTDGVAMSPGAAVECFRGLLQSEGAWFSVPMPWPNGKIPAMPPTTISDVRRELRGKNLACWCPIDQACHADVLLEVANGKA